MTARRALTTCSLAAATFALAVSTFLPVPRADTPGGAQASPAAERPQDRPRGSGLLIDGVRDTGQFLPDTAVILEVGERRVTARDYIDAYFSSDPELRPRNDSLGRVAFLGTLIDKLVMDRLVLQANRPLTFEDRHLLREHEARVLSNVLYLRTVVDSVVVTDQDLARVQRDMGQQLQVRHILFEDQFTAQTVRDSLVRRRLTWEAAHARYSRATNDSGPAGHIGWATPLDFDPALAEHLFGLEAGGISQPRDTDDGVDVYQVVTRRAVKPLSIADVRASLVRHARARQTPRRTEAVLEQLRAEAGITYDTTNMVWAVRRYVESPSLFIRPAAEDTGRVLARTNEGPFTLGALVSYYQQTSPLLQARLNTFNRMRDEVDAAALEPYRVRVARRRGLERDPQTIVLMERRRMEILAEHLYQDSIEARVQVTPRERRKFFDDSLSRRMTEARIRHALFVRNSAEGADSVVVRLLAGEPAHEILRADSLQGARRGRISEALESQEIIYRHLLWEELTEGRVGVFGPTSHGQYFVIQHLGMDPGHLMTYREAEAMADEAVRNLKADRMTRAFLDRHRRGVRIVAHPELLMRIRLIASDV